MKKRIYLIVLSFVAVCISGQVIAQSAKNINTSESNIKNISAAVAEPNRSQCVVGIAPNETGCEIVFTNDVKGPRDAASGLATGRRMHQPISFKVSAADNSVSEVVSPRDVASGQASGKRTAGNPIGGLTIKGGKNPGGNQFNGLVVNDGKFSLPSNCPDGDCDLFLSWSWGVTNSGSSKSYAQCHFILTMENGACVAVKSR